MPLQFQGKSETVSFFSVKLDSYIVLGLILFGQELFYESVWIL